MLSGARLRSRVAPEINRRPRGKGQATNAIRAWPHEAEREYGLYRRERSRTHDRRTGEHIAQTDARIASQAAATSNSKALRERMIAELIEPGILTDPAIEAAFRPVPREVLAPADTPAERQ